MTSRANLCTPYYLPRTPPLPGACLGLRVDAPLNLEILIKNSFHAQTKIPHVIQTTSAVRPIHAQPLQRGIS